MRRESVDTYWVRIHLAGDINMAKQIIREDVYKKGLCVTIRPELFIYTGGEEEGYVVELINYPRFPNERGIIWNRAKSLALKLLEGTYQNSVLLMSSTDTLWITKRDTE